MPTALRTRLQNRRSVDPKTTEMEKSLATIDEEFVPESSSDAGQTEAKLVTKARKRQTTSDAGNKMQPLARDNSRGDHDGSEAKKTRADGERTAKKQRKTPKDGTKPVRATTMEPLGDGAPVLNSAGSSIQALLNISLPPELIQALTILREFNNRLSTMEKTLDHIKMLLKR